MKKSNTSDKFSKFRKAVKSKMNIIGIGSSKPKSKMKCFLNAMSDNKVTDQSHMDVDITVSNTETMNQNQDFTTDQVQLIDFFNSTINNDRGSVSLFAMNDNVEKSKTDEDSETKTANEMSFDDKITIELTDNLPTKTVGFNER